MSVIHMIADEYRYPHPTELWEAFQPKLYHTVVALALRLSPLRMWVHVRIAQLISCAASIVTLLVIAAFLRHVEVPVKARRVAVAIAATCAGITAIGAQATNDSFVILFASLALVSGYQYFAAPGYRSLVWMSVFCVLAGVSKGNGLVFFVAALVSLCLVVIRPSARVRSEVLRHTLVFGIFCGSATAFLGPYVTLARTTGSPLTTNWQPSPRPHVFRKTFVERPGLTSLASGFGTFRLIGLLRHPASTSHRTEYPTHRTSLWSRVYAQTVSTHFEAWPPSWEARSRWSLGITKALLVLGLVPLGLTVYGLATFTLRSMKAFFEETSTAAQARFFVTVTAWGYLAFVVVYAVRLRDYSSMKAIFVYPALVAFLWMMADATAKAFAALSARRWMTAVFSALVGAFVVASLTDVALLFYQLSWLSVP